MSSKPDIAQKIAPAIHRRNSVVSVIGSPVTVAGPGCGEIGQGRRNCDRHGRQDQRQGDRRGYRDTGCVQAR